MSLSLGIGLALTHKHDHNWWNAFREGGLEATLVLSFKTDQYYNQIQKDLADLSTFTRASTGTYTDLVGILQTASVDALRFSHDPVTLSPLGVLLEQSATNLFTQSADFNNAVWVKTGFGTSVSSDASISPDGGTNSDLLFTSSGALGEVTLRYTFVYAISTTYTISIFAKKGNLDWLRVRELAHNGAGSGVAVSEAWFNLDTGVKGSATGGISAYDMEDVGGGFYRCFITFTTAGSIDNNLIDVGCSNADLVSVWTHTPNDGIYLWGCQLETGAIATSYIPTAGSSAIRAVDSLFTTDSSLPFLGYDQTKVSGKITLTPNADGALTYISYNDTTANEVIEIHQDASNNIRLTVTDGGVVQCDIDSLVNAVIGSEVTIAFRAGVNDFAISVDGNTEQTDTVGTMPTTTQQEFGGAGIVAEEVAYNELITDLAGLSA